MSRAASSMRQLYRFVVEVQFGQRDVRVALAVLVVLTTAACAWWGRRHRRAPVAAWLAGCSLSLVLAKTLVPSLGFAEYRSTPWRAARLGVELGHPDRLDLTSWWHGYDGALNVLLFVPAGCFVLAWTGRAVPSLLALAALSLGIEAVQAASGTRSGSWSDVVGTLLGSCWGWSSEPRPGD